MQKKIKGDAAELYVAYSATERGWAVSRPLTDRLPYDLIIDNGKALIKVQVKAAWQDAQNAWRTGNTKGSGHYKDSDFHYAIVVAGKVFYIFPSKKFNSYGGNILLHRETENRMAGNQTYNFYRNNWNQLAHFSGLHVIVEQPLDNEFDF